MTQFDANAYQKHVKTRAPRSKVGLACVNAFWTGGLICVLGQGISDAGRLLFSLDKDGCAALTAIVLVFLAALLTAIGVYDRIAQLAGAGSVVPITGFSNSIVSPAIEFQPEGLVMGVGAKLFSIAGPVLVYGVGSSVIVGLISLLFR